MERHEWHLRRQGKRLSGFLNHSVTWISRGPQVFACNRQRRAGHLTRYLVTGRIDPQPILSLAQLFQQGDCPPREAPLTSCSIQQGVQSKLTLKCHGVTYALDRGADQPIPLFLAAHTRDQLTGVWVWHHRSIDQDGDTKLEVETWRLRQNKDKITGHYDRRVTIHSKDGRPFKCNNQTHYTNQSRFRLEGVVSGELIRFQEQEYLIQGGACENGKRQLDQYTGTFNVKDQTLQLSWGKGKQLLWRRY